VPDLTIMGSHCIGLEAVIDALARDGVSVRTVAIGSLGGLSAAKRGECDLAPIHLFDPQSEIYNHSFLGADLLLVEGWRRLQGFVFRKDDPRFEDKNFEAALATALADPTCHMVNRNQGAGTRILIDRLLKEARPEGYWNQPKSHNAVAAAIAQNRADWGLAIAPAAKAYGLGFLPYAEEHYDFAVPKSRRETPAVRAFIAALATHEVKEALRALGFTPAIDTSGPAECA